MTREQLIANFDNTVNQARAILERRNVIYAKKDNALFNIKQLGYKGILTQIREKCTRLENIIEVGLDNEETSDAITDSCLDIINYSFLFQALVEEE